jgi:GTP-binding protein YchF
LKYNYTRVKIKSGLKMSIGIGITGLAQSGRTTIFNALTRGQADTKTTTPHLGVTKVPEPRLKTLADMLHPKKVVPAEVSYTDIGASVKTTGSQILNQLATADALLNVVRAFANESVPHVEGSIDVERDIATNNLELAVYDSGIINRRLEKIESSLKGAKPPERQSLLHEQELLTRIKTELEKETPARELSLTGEELKTIAGYQFLTAKPLLIVVNIGEEQIAQAKSLEAELNSRYSRPNSSVITLCGKLEMELAQLDDDAAQSFQAEFGLTESGLDRVIKLSYELLGLISFFTIASGEVKAWSIPRGTPALKAAGKIHSDMERGFIRAEVVSYDDLVKCGSLAEAQNRGLLRREGKSYPVEDGDVVTFLFNV